MTSTLALVAAPTGRHHPEVEFEEFALDLRSADPESQRLLLLHQAAAAQGQGHGDYRQGSGYEVGDEVQTVGGVIGTVLEIHGDRYTLLTGALGDDGNLDGPQPTRIVFVRQAIARKIEPIADVGIDDTPTEDDVHDVHHSRTTRPTSTTSEATLLRPHTGEHGGEAEEE